MVKENLLKHDKFTAIGAASLVRNIASSRKIEPMDKVHRLRDFGGELTEHHRINTPVEQLTYCGRFKKCLGMCWQMTGIKFTVKNDFPANHDHLDWVADIIRPCLCWCIVFAGAIVSIILMLTMSEDETVELGISIMGGFLLFWLCCCCCCGRCCWEFGPQRITLDISAIFENIYAFYSVNGNQFFWRWRTACKCCHESFLAGAPHAHTGDIQPLRVHGNVEVFPVPASLPLGMFNYMYLIVDLPSGEVAGVDIAEPEIALDYLKWLNRRHQRQGRRKELVLTTLLTTHKHHDHAQGNVWFHRLKRDHDLPNIAPKVEIYGGKGEGVPYCTHELDDGQGMTLGNGTRVTAIITPGHTSRHTTYFVRDIGYYDEDVIVPGVMEPGVPAGSVPEAGNTRHSGGTGTDRCGDDVDGWFGAQGKHGIPLAVAKRKRRMPPTFGERVAGDYRGADEFGELPAHRGAVFTGDCLFISGCGQLFEGDELEFVKGIDKLRKLPRAAAVYVGHEYTESLAPWACWLEPDSKNAADKLDWMLKQRYGSYQPMPTIPSTIQVECDTNPYLRCNQQSVITRLGCEMENVVLDGSPSLTQDELLKREAAVLKKLINLKKNTLDLSMLPFGLPRSYNAFEEEARKRLPAFARALSKLKAQVLLRGPTETWMAHCNLEPRCKALEQVDPTSDDIREAPPARSPERTMFTPEQTIRNATGEVIIELDENPVAEDEASTTRLHVGEEDEKNGKDRAVL